MSENRLEVIIGANTSNFQRGIKQAQTGLSSIKTSALSAAKTVQTGLSSIKTSALSGIENIKSESNSIKSGLSSISKSAISAAKAGLAVAGVTVGLQQLSESLKAYTGLESNISRVNSLFSDSSKYISDFAENTAFGLGMAESSAYQYAATYGNLFRTITTSTEENAKVTTAMLKASAVISSKTGRTMDDVSERIRSGLLGSTEAIEDLGIQVNVASLEMSDAFRKIANGRSWEQLNYYEQQQIRTLAILEQAQASFGNEVDRNSAFNLSALSNAFKDLQTTVGMFINKALQPVVQWLTELVQWANMGLKSLAALFGFDMTISETATTGIGAQTKAQNGLTDAVNETVKANKRLLASFDEVNIIKQSASGSGGVSGTSGGISSAFSALPTLNFDESTGSMLKFSETFEKVKPFFDGIVEAVKDIGEAVEGFYDTYLYSWLVSLGEWAEENPETLKNLGYGLAIFVAALGLYKGLTLVSEITGIGKLISKIGEWLLGTKGVTDAMNKKTEALGKQTEATVKETVSVAALIPVIGLALLGILGLKNILNGTIPAINGNEEAVGKLKDKLDELGKQLPVAAKETVDETVNIISEGAKSVSEENQLLSDGFAQMSDSVTETMDTFSSSIQSNLNTVEEEVNSLISAINQLNGLTISPNISEDTLTSPTSSASASSNSRANIMEKKHDYYSNLPDSESQQPIKDSTLSSSNSRANIMEKKHDYYSNPSDSESQQPINNNLSDLENQRLKKIQENGGSGSPIETNRTGDYAVAIAKDWAGAIWNTIVGGFKTAVPGFATGGVVTSPTQALIGEYPNASSNPEIVSPQNIMYDTVVEANAPMVSAIVEAIQRLEQTLREKDLEIAIGDDEIVRSAARGNNDYIKRTGKSLLTV